MVTMMIERDDVVVVTPNNERTERNVCTRLFTYGHIEGAGVTEATESPNRPYTGQQTSTNDPHHTGTSFAVLD